MRLAGKTALVTAAAAGIGRATALAFAREGANVIATDVDPATLASIADENPSIRLEAMDVADQGAIDRVREGAPTIDILFNAAGVVPVGTILDCTEEQWAWALNVNLTGMFRTIKAWLPGMIEGGGGSIVNIASVASSMRGVPQRSCYAATKAGVIGLTKSVAADFVGKGVRCNAICPGPMGSPSFAQRLRDSGDEAAARAAVNAGLPMGRVGRIEEAAALAVYLASDESGYTTGATHVIDGGWRI